MVNSRAQAEPPESLNIDHINRITTEARQTGALEGIETQYELVDEQGFRFIVRWIPALAQKEADKIRRAGQKSPGFNPFLPPEPTLFVGALGPHHNIILNKFPVINPHLLLVTQSFEDQSSALTQEDFSALTTMLTHLRGLVFYNGGAAAGASQAHKHFQWVPALPEDVGLHRFTTGLCADKPLIAVRHPRLPWRHAFVRHTTDGTLDAGKLFAAFQIACQSSGLPTQQRMMPPYNLLVDSNWLLIVPRSNECHEGISINSLGFAGSLFVKHPDQVKVITRSGPLSLLSAVALEC